MPELSRRGFLGALLAWASAWAWLKLPRRKRDELELKSVTVHADVPISVTIVSGDGHGVAHLEHSARRDRPLPPLSWVAHG